MIPFQILSKETVFWILYLMCSMTNFAQDLILDETYGNNGVYFTEASKILGKVIVDRDKFLVIDEKVISRLNFDGTLDETFGISGKRDLYFGGLSFKISNYVVKNSSIYLCGWIEQAEYGASRDVLIIKIDSNGNYDSFFGTNGYTTVDFGKHELLESIYITEQDEVIATGSIVSREFTNSYENLFIVKLLNNGSIDYSYYEKGYLETSLTDKQSTIGQFILKSFNEGYYLMSKGNMGEKQNKWSVTKLKNNVQIDSEYAINGTFFSDIESVNDNIISVKIDSKDFVYVISQFSTPPNESAGGILFRKINLQNLETLTSFKLENSTGAINDLFIDENQLATLSFLDKNCNDNGDIFFCRRDFYFEKYKDSGELDFNFNSTGSYNITQFSFLDEYQPKVGIIDIKKIIGGYEVYGVAGKKDGNYKIWSIRLKEAPLGINDFSKSNELFVLPNPTLGLITISSPNNEIIKNISVYSVDGNLLIKKTNSNYIDISSLHKGLYLFKIETDTSIYTKKVMKN